jgi:hypothetical protein
MQRSNREEYFEIRARYIDFNGSTFYYVAHRMYGASFCCRTYSFSEIPVFNDVSPIHALPAQPLSHGSEIKDQLRARGAEFVKLKGTHYLEYHDVMIQKQRFGLEEKLLKFRAISPVPSEANLVGSRPCYG